MERQDAVRKRFGRLTVIKFFEMRKHSQSYWICRCDCGNSCITRLSSLKFGTTKSCGCLHREIISKFSGENSPTFKHGFFGNRFYRCYAKILERCNNVKVKEFKNYGSRGIKCLWKSFEEFRDDMYESYQVHVDRFGEINTFIERIDNNGNYCKENCRWATKKEQARNTRRTQFIEYRGESRCIKEWSEIFNIRYETLHHRIKYHGWPIEKALTTPVR